MKVNIAHFHTSLTNENEGGLLSRPTPGRSSGTGPLGNGSLVAVCPKLRGGEDKVWTPQPIAVCP